MYSDVTDFRFPNILGMEIEAGVHLDFLVLGSTVAREWRVVSELALDFSAKKESSNFDTLVHDNLQSNECFCSA